jgi:hypothetical protein
MTTITAPRADVLTGVRGHVSVKETLSQTMTMAWRATKKTVEQP